MALGFGCVSSVCCEQKPQDRRYWARLVLAFVLLLSAACLAMVVSLSASRFRLATRRQSETPAAGVPREASARPQGQGAAQN